MLFSGITLKGNPSKKTSISWSGSSTFCEGSETLLEWKSESITDGPTNGHTDGAGAADACASKYLEAA